MAIRPDSDPKNASPQADPPKGELEQYGVWVKAEPQDVIEEVAVPVSSDLDFDIPGVSAPPPEEAFLSEDEEKLLGTFDADFEGPAGSPSDESGPLPDIEDMPPLEESLLGAEPAPVMEEIEDTASSSIDVSLEDIESMQPSTTVLPDEASASAAPRSASIEDVSSEFLNPEGEPVAVRESEQAADAALDSGLDDVTAEFLGGEETGTLPRVPERSVDFEPLDIDLQFDDSSSPASDNGPQPVSVEAGFEAVTEFDDFLSADSPNSEPPAGSASAGFDDVEAVERDLSEALPETLPESLPVAAARPDLSTEILLKIADELSSIRGELVSLKTQIGDVMRSAAPPATKTAETLPEEAEESAPGGFFDEEEDETIALTGDELDNILNTADFTEEIAEAEVPIDIEAEALAAESTEIHDSSLLDETLLPESGDYATAEGLAKDLPSPHAEPAIEEVRLGQSDSVDEIGLEPLEPEAAELSLVVEEGVTPMTAAPEDTSYLESGESLDAGVMTLDGAPLGDEPLVEPDLSDFSLETEETEPRLEIDEELPLAAGELDSSAEELTLGIETGPGYAAEESAVDAEFLEPVPEIEEPDFSDINLHEEGFDASGKFDVHPEAVEEALPLEEEEDLVLEVEQEGSPKPESPPIALSEAPVARSVPEPSDDGDRLKAEIKSVLSYLDKLLDSLPEEKIEEFANSEYFDTYKKLFEELGLV